MNAPKRSGLIRLDSSFFKGDIARVQRLPAVPGREQIDALVNGGQILASFDGESVAIITTREGGEIVSHNNTQLTFQLFEARRVGQFNQGTVLLEVSPLSVRVWGSPVGHPTGIYEITHERCELLEEMPFLKGVHRTKSGTVVLGDDHEMEPSGTRVFTDHGAIFLRPGSVVMPLSDGTVQIVERISGRHFRYRFTREDPFMDFHEVFTKADEHLIALVHLHGLKILCFSGAHRSRFSAVGAMRHLFGDNGEVELEGQLERVWQSPEHKSIAWLIRTSRRGFVKRELYLNGDLVHRGSFTMHHDDLRWSPDEQSIGVRLSPLLPDASNLLVTTESVLEIDRGQVVDFLVDDDGAVAAMLTRAGERFLPLVYDRPHDSVPFAWNLAWEDGAVRYNSVQHTSVLNVRDATHL